jgi:hypothetical protein
VLVKGGRLGSIMMTVLLEELETFFWVEADITYWY